MAAYSVDVSVQISFAVKSLPASVTIAAWDSHPRSHSSGSMIPTACNVTIFFA